MKSWNLSESLAGLTLEAGRAIYKDSNRLLESSEVRSVSFPTLKILNFLSHRPACQRELCEQIGIKPPSMTTALRRIQSLNLVKSKDHADDRRKTEWVLTPHGVDALKDYAKLFRGRGRDVDRFFKDEKITSQEVEVAKKVLHKLIEFVEKQDD